MLPINLLHNLLIINLCVKRSAIDPKYKSSPTVLVRASIEIVSAITKAKAQLGWC
jgi:hypothetical protein